MLDKSSSTREILNWKTTQGFRWPKIIRDLLVKARVVDPSKPPTSSDKNIIRKRCSKASCRYCIKLNKTGSIISPITGREYNTIRNCDCKTNNIIYCITCTICYKQCIGHIKRTLGERMCEHFRYITQHNSTHYGVGRHYNTDDHSGLRDVSLHVLQFGRNNPDSKESLGVRLKLEQLWIHRLRSTTRMGLNVFD